jgi:pimeloyl-ACP methyl ester carboxylesterase
MPESTQPVLCGQHEVFEDRAAQAGRRITLKIVVVPALSAPPAGDPVFVFVGGPGLGAASGVRGDGGGLTNRLRRERDVVFVDQRGTGASHRLPCSFADDPTQSYVTDLLPVDRIRACREAAAAGANVTLYTTPIAMEDLDEIRAALGYEQINLYGVSYGAQAALQYLRQYPRRVRVIAIAGVATPAAKQPLSFARAAHDAMRALIADCAGDAVCARAFPKLEDEFQAVLTAAEAGRATMARAVFVERLRLMLYDLESARRVPLVVHRAAQGDWGPFMRLSPTGITSGVSAMYLTVTCAETTSQISEPDIVRETRDTFVGEYRTRAHLRACREWPRAQVPPAYYEPVTSAVPALILSGELDAATPAHFARTAARSLRNGRHVIARNVAHDYSSDCMQRLVAEFIAAGSARDLDIACVHALRRPPFVTRLPGDD